MSIAAFWLDIYSYYSIYILYHIYTHYVLQKFHIFQSYWRLLCPEENISETRFWNLYIYRSVTLRSVTLLQSQQRSVFPFSRFAFPRFSLTESTPSKMYWFSRVPDRENNSITLAWKTWETSDVDFGGMHWPKSG